MSNILDTSYYPLDEIHQEFLKYAPAYAQEEARQAISKVLDLQKQGVLRNGLFYIVLTDLVGSTKYIAKYGNEKASSRIQNFITSSFDALNESNIKNIGLFVKEIGDAVLFIFQHFPDILRWKTMFDKWLRVWSKPDEPIVVRTCIHIGEVFLDGVNPLSLAVSQTFKMEKTVNAGDIVLTNPAYVVAWPTLARAHHGFEDYGTVVLDGFTEPVPLHRLVVRDEQDTERMILEQHD
jgi:class 3 adenylate cyclase